MGQRAQLLVLLACFAVLCARAHAADTPLQDDELKAALNQEIAQRKVSQHSNKAKARAVYLHSGYGDGLEFSLVTEKAVYDVGEPIWIDYEWKNGGKTPVVLEGPRPILRPRVTCAGSVPSRLKGSMGEVVDGNAWFFTLNSGQERKVRWLLNPFQYQADSFAFLPCQYRATDNYQSTRIGDVSESHDAWEGSLSTRTFFVVRTPSVEDLLRFRQEASEGNPNAIAALGILKDVASVAVLRDAYLHVSTGTQNTVGFALFLINTDEAIEALSELALHSELPEMNRIEIIWMLGAAGNKKAVPALIQLAKVSMATKFYSIVSGEKRFETPIRRTALRALQQLGVLAPNSMETAVPPN